MAPGHGPLKASLISSSSSKVMVQHITNALKIDDSSVARRSADYMPSVWNYDFVQSLASNYNEEKYINKANKMKDDVKCLIRKEMDSMAKLELIDFVQRLGLLYHFETDIKKALDIIHKDSTTIWLHDDDLYATSLRFRLLRQHGYHVPQGVFERFKEPEGDFMESHCKDVKGMLYMYEASFFGFEGETTIDEAKAFSTKCLKNIIINGGEILLSPLMGRKIEHALDMPLHWRIPRLEARWFIDTYQQEKDMNPILLHLAKLDYNIVQSVHMKEVSTLARWWVDMGLDKVSFSRDRLVEHYFWCNGMLSEPKYGDFRHMTTKVVAMITIMDDIYDLYGSLEELELFTNFIDRWDISGIDKLPHDIKRCLLALYNTTNDIGYWTIKERNFNIIPYLSNTWANLCKSYLKEAKWYHKGYKPTLQEYLDNAVISVAAPIVLFCCYFITVETINVETLNYIDKLPRIMRCPAMIVRLTNDLVTSSDELARGDTLKSVQCYMNETGASEEVAREYINGLIDETWKTLNKEMLKPDNPFSEPFKTVNPNLGRMAKCIYQYGDGQGLSDHLTKGHLDSLLVQSIPLD